MAATAAVTATATVAQNLVMYV